MANGKKMYEFQKRCLDGIYICLRGDYIQDPETGKMMGSRPSEKFDKSGDSGIIKETEKLNASSANTILKFLEEPEDGIIAILLTDNRYHVLDTILSRCQILSLKENEFKLKKVSNTYIKN